MVEYSEIVSSFVSKEVNAVFAYTAQQNCSKRKAGRFKTPVCWKPVKKSSVKVEHVCNSPRT